MIGDNLKLRCERWMKPDGTLVLDFTEAPPEERTQLVASRRSTSNSRGPGQEGVVYFNRIGLKLCEDCGTRVPSDTEPGTHARHHDLKGHMVNCVGKAIS